MMSASVRRGLTLFLHRVNGDSRQNISLFEAKNLIDLDGRLWSGRKLRRTLSGSDANWWFDPNERQENHENQGQFCRRTDTSDVRSLSDCFVDDFGHHGFDLLLLPEY